jgi:3-dehydroshikimate dehydratase
MGNGCVLTLSGFADEISDNLTEQVAVLKQLDVRGLDLRSVGGVNVLQLSDDDLVDVRRQCEANGLVVQAIGSPVNKVSYSSNRADEELEKLRRAIHAAKLTGTDRIRIFSPQVPQGQDEAMWPAVRDWFAPQVALAQESNVVLLHENDGSFYGAYPANARRLLEEFHGPHFRAIYDFANSVLLGPRTMRDWFPWIVPYLHTLHIKDAVQATRQIVPSGQGDGEMREAFELLMEAGWSGTLTLEPHLKSGGPYGGTSGPELFEVAVKAIREVVRSVGGTC